MGIIIADKSEKIKSLYASFWQWHPLVDLIESMQLLDPERITLMHEKVPVTVTPAEAHEIGTRIKAQILPRLKPEERLLLNMEVTAEPDDLQMHYDDVAKTTQLRLSGWHALRIFAWFVTASRPVRDCFRSAVQR
jgi:hypothetical protein